MEKFEILVESFLRSNDIYPGKLKRYIKVLNDKWNKIEEVLKNKNIFKYIFFPSGNEIWVIMGKTDEYLIIPGFYCSCHDFYFNAILRRKEICCYHLLAQILSQKLEDFTTFYKSDDFLQDYLDDLLELANF